MKKWRNDITQIELCGILWDTENTVTDGKEYFTWEEAQELAKEKGKRLPTKEEFKALSELPHTWDPDKKGMWFANTRNNLKKEDKSLFFPASGYRFNSDGELNTVGVLGFCWSSSAYSASSAYVIHFTSRRVYPEGYNFFLCGFPVRCVLN